MRTLLIMFLVCAACESASISEQSPLNDEPGVDDIAAQLQAEAAGSGSQTTQARQASRDKCARSNGGCEQICKTEGRSSVCGCEAGAYLKSDGRSCWSWHTVQRIESYDGGDATEPRVACDAQGRATAVWTQMAGEMNSVWSSRLANSGWGAAVEIDGQDARGANRPQLTMSDDGNVVALWNRQRESIAYIANLFRNGAWGTPQTLFESAPSSAFFGPVLSGSRNGAALSARASTAGRGSTLGVSTLSGTTWTSGGLPLGAAISFPTMGNIRTANGPNGEGTVLWSQLDNAGLKLWINQFRNAQWGTPLQVDAGAADSFGEAGIAIVRGPAELVVWKAAQAIWANKRTSAWIGAVKIRDLPAGATVGNVQVVSDSRGNAAFALWLENDRVWSSAFNGNTWSPAVNIEAVTTGIAASPSIALEPSGIAVAVWSHAAARSDVWANRYAPGGGWGTAVRLENDDAGDAAAPSVAVDSRGNAQAVWQQFDGTRFNVISNHFD